MHSEVVASASAVPEFVEATAKGTSSLPLLLQGQESRRIERISSGREPSTELEHRRQDGGTRQLLPRPDEAHRAVRGVRLWGCPRE